MQLIQIISVLHLIYCLYMLFFRHLMYGPWELPCTALFTGR